MGLNVEKNAELSDQLEATIIKNLSSLNGISTKKMFGGYGIFHEDKMFGLIDSKGNCFLKANEENKEDYLSSGGEQHSRMPYYSISEEILNDTDKLLPLAQFAIQISK